MSKNGFTNSEDIKTRSFWLGRMLSLADEIHYKFFSIRNMPVPNQLIGSKMMNTALKNPKMFLSRFMPMFKTYYEWAKKTVERSSVKKDTYIPWYEFLEALNKVRDESKQKWDKYHTTQFMFGYAYRQTKNSKKGDSNE